MPVEYRALLILAFMIGSFLLNKWPKGLTTMFCCLMAYAFGILDLQASFSGLTDPIVLMLAGLFVSISALQQTTAMAKIKGVLGALSNRSPSLLLIGFLAIIVLFAQMMGTTASVPLLISFLCTLPDRGDITVSRLAIPVAGLTAMWQYTFPIGSSLTLVPELNSYYEAFTTDASQLITLLEPLKFKLLPCILVTVWTFFGYKLMPKAEADLTSANRGGAKKEAEKLPLWKELIIYGVMIADMAGLFLNSVIGEWQYVIPVVGIFVLAFTHCLTVPSIVKNITNDIVWMIAGILVVSDVLNVSGAGQLIGDTIVSFLGENPNKVVALLIFGGATGVMTNLMSNIASRSIVVPIAALTAISAGWNPVPFVLTVSQMAWCAVVLPSASSAAAMGHAVANQRLQDSLKYTIPFFILSLGGCILSTLLFF